jgi:hypothetical protein
MGSGMGGGSARVRAAGGARRAVKGLDVFTPRSTF